MEPFRTAAQTWTPPQTRWHVHVLPRPQDERMAEPLRACETVALDVAGDALVPTGRFAHPTVQQISRPAAEIPREQIDAFAEDLERRIASIAPFTVAAGPAMATTGAVLLDMDQDLPGEPWHLLDAVVKDAIRGRFGEQALKYETRPPPMTVDALWLLDVRQNVQTRTYTWPQEAGRRIPLGRVPS